jgi:hypothetical protein
MAKIEQFEDIEAWQMGRELKKEIYRCSKRGEFAKDFALRDQIRRAAISVTANIAEGFERERISGAILAFIKLPKSGDRSFGGLNLKR